MPRHIYDEDHEALRASAREFVERTLKPRAEQMIEVKSIERDLWKEAGKQGFFGFDIPEEYGGAGVQDYRFNAVLCEEWAGFSAAISSCFGIHADVCPPYIVDLGTEEQKQRWLPGIASGDLIIAIGMTEPSGGSDLAALKTTAVRDGDGWVLNGSKTFITNGYQADLVIVAARTDASKGAKGITLFMVERDMEGFANGRKLDKVGMPESDTAELFFDDVRVPDENRLGPEGLGFISMMQRLPQERVGSAVNNVAHAKAVLEETIQYAKDRKAFGQSIGAFQYNKFLL
ncbi:MAG: acyl-CoA dehydrogenase family protein, partial [Dermatophilaceae bacterium]